MKLVLKQSLALSLLFPGIAAAQEFFSVAPDTRFPVELRQTLRATQARVGDPVKFRTLEPILIGNGIVVPQNASLLGEVVYVRSDPNASPRSWLRIRVNGLRWKTGQASINAVVDAIYYVRSAYIDTLHRRMKATFLEGITVDPHLFRNASTDFFSDSKEVVLRSGILLQMRHIVPREDDGQTLSASSTSSGKQ